MLHYSYFMFLKIELKVNYTYGIKGIVTFSSLFNK